MNARKLEVAIFLLALFSLNKTKVSTQSIGDHPTLNLGFNPYMSPIYGYGLGLGYGLTSLPPSILLSGRPLANSLLKTGNIVKKIHEKKLLKQLALPEKLMLLKHPENTFTPYGMAYGFGNHYGSATVPNNPYKSTYSDYYSGSQPLIESNQPDLLASASSPIQTITNLNDHSSTSTLLPRPFNQAPLEQQASPYIDSLANSKVSWLSKKLMLLKPLVKISALLTAAALVAAKKSFDMTGPLNPAGMIISDPSLSSFDRSSKKI